MAALRHAFVFGDRLVLADSGRWPHAGQDACANHAPPIQPINVIVVRIAAAMRIDATGVAFGKGASTLAANSDQEDK
jgi:hypothetical protein